jgi:acetate kinase
MARTLVINTGSSSKKYAIYDDGREILYVTVTRETDEIRCGIRKDGTWLGDEHIDEAEYTNSITRVLAIAKKHRSIDGVNTIATVAIRVVAPGTFFARHRVIDAEYIDALRAVVPAAPLHIPPALAEIEAVRTALPDATHVAASDSAFHSTKPAEAARYSIQNEDVENLDVRRFGYHGLSVQSILHRLHAVTGTNPARVIVVHVGSGVSVTAVRDGESIDTTMGFAPGSGVVMASRSGDIDAGALLELMRRKSMGIHDAYTYLHTRGGLFGMSGEADFRHVLERHAVGDTDATMALKVFAYSVRTALGSMLAALNGIDCVVLTATAAQRSPVLRAMCVSELTGLGITIDREKNEEHVSRDGVLSPPGSTCKVVVMQTDEMGEMNRVATQLHN